MPRHVWLCTRPLAYAIPGIELSSDGRPYLRHWGVLVTEMTILDAKEHFQTTSNATAGLRLGTMYQLLQLDNESNVFDSDFSVEKLKNEWRSIDAQYVGETVFTHEMISKKGIHSFFMNAIDYAAGCIINSRPTYRIFHNNCQNFATYLLEALCPGVPIPDTIEKVLQRMQEFLEASQTSTLPGAPQPLLLRPVLLQMKRAGGR
jgi:hypothetical protein